MKGIVYTLFQDMVEDEFGLEVWEFLLENSELSSEGIYTSGNTYADEEMQQLIAGLSQMNSSLILVVIKILLPQSLNHIMHGEILFYLSV